MIHLDTHVVVWLYTNDLGRFPPEVRALLENELLAISPMVALELEYLYEVKRTTAPAATVLQSLQHALGLRQDDSSFAAVVHAATQLTWTCDPFDRIIAAQALVAGCPLLTADMTIRQHLACAKWG